MFCHGPSPRAAHDPDPFPELVGEHFVGLWVDAVTVHRFSLQLLLLGFVNSVDRQRHWSSSELRIPDVRVLTLSMMITGLK
jgi:hypothetical protein